jgi:transcriptional regulator with XRE-family HTH domain
VLRSNVPRAVRHLRRHRGWRQVDLGRRAKLSRDTVSRCEQGALGGLTVASLEGLAEALGATLVVELRWEGAGLDRLMDRAHASLVEAAARRLRRLGWTAQAEVSFNHYGDRGSCDLLAYHVGSGIVLVVEAKASLGNLQETLHRLDVKARLGPMLATQLGWPSPGGVARAIVLLGTRTNRRVIERHPDTFQRYALRGRSAIAWLRRPSGERAALLWFQLVPDSDEGRAMQRQRVRTVSRAG